MALVAKYEARDGYYYNLVYSRVLKRLQSLSPQEMGSFLQDTLNGQHFAQKYLPVFADYDDFSRKYWDDSIPKDLWFNYDRPDDIAYYMEKDRDILYYLAKNERIDRPFIWLAKLNKFKDVGVYDFCELTADICGVLAKAVAEAIELGVKDRDMDRVVSYYVSLSEAKKLEFLKTIDHFIFTRSWVRYFSDIDELKDSGLYDDKHFSNIAGKYKSGDVIAVELSEEGEVRWYRKANLSIPRTSLRDFLRNNKMVKQTLVAINGVHKQK